MSIWDEIGAELDALAKANGGKHQLYKPVIRIEIYEHDDEVTVEVGQCKGMNKVVIHKGTIGGPYPEGLLWMLKEARKEAEAEA